MNVKKPDVLVLNRVFVPIHIVDHQTAMTLIYTEKCRPLDRDYLAYTFNDWLNFSSQETNNYPKLHTINYPIAIPEIIVSTTFDKLPQRQVKYSRTNVMARDKYRCGYCGKQFNRKDLTIDHIHPRCKGGKTTWDNVISCCFPCNQKKDNKTMAEAGMKLRFLPKAPKWMSPLTHISMKEHPCKSWSHFMYKVSTEIENED